MGFKMKYPIKPQYLSAPSKRRSGIKAPTVLFIVAHDTGNDGSTAKGNVGYYQTSRNQMEASAHTFIDDVEIIECIPATTGTPEKAWHVLYNKPLDNQLFGDDANDVAIGVELCYSYQRGHINNLEAYKRYVWYLAYLCYKFKLDPATKIIGHSRLDPGRKTDPENALSKMGKTFNQLIADVVAEYKACTAVVAVPVEKEDDTLKLEDQWQWDLLANTIRFLLDKNDPDILNGEEWYTKVKNKTITVSELAFLNTVILARMNGGKL